MTQIATNRDKHINEASRQAFSNNLFKKSCNYMQGILFIWKVCFNVLTKENYDQFFLFFEQN